MPRNQGGRRIAGEFCDQRIEVIAPIGERRETIDIVVKRGPEQIKSVAAVDALIQGQRQRSRAQRGRARLDQCAQQQRPILPVAGGEGFAFHVREQCLISKSCRSLQHRFGDGGGHGIAFFQPAARELGRFFLQHGGCAAVRGERKQHDAQFARFVKRCIAFSIARAYPIAFSIHGTGPFQPPRPQGLRNDLALHDARIAPALRIIEPIVAQFLQQLRHRAPHHRRRMMREFFAEREHRIDRHQPG